MLAVLIIDINGSILFANKASESVFGYRAEELLSRNVNVLMPPQETPEKHDLYLGNFARSGDPHIIGKERIVQARRKDGSLVKLRLMVSQSRSHKHEIFTGALLKSYSYPPFTHVCDRDFHGSGLVLVESPRCDVSTNL